MAAGSSLFHQILDQHDVSAANTTTDSIGSELFDTRTVEHDAGPRYCLFSILYAPDSLLHIL